MNGQIKTWPWSAPGSLTSRLLVITGLLTLVGILGILAASVLELADLRLAVLAFVVCLFSSLLAHVAGEYPQGDGFLALRMAASMLVRTVLPFLVCLIAKLSPAIAFETGFVFFVLLFYLIGLIIDVALHTARLNRC